MKQRTNLQQPRINKILKVLEERLLVKSVKSVQNASRKVGAACCACCWAVHAHEQPIAEHEQPIAEHFFDTLLSFTPA